MSSSPQLMGSSSSGQISTQCHFIVNYPIHICSPWNSRFGLKKMGSILIWSSFVIPLLMSLLTSAVQTIEYNGTIAPLKFYELSCSYPKLREFKVDTSSPCYNCYRSPIYNLAHSHLPASTINAMWIFNVFAACILYSNATEGIIYIRSAIFVFR